MTKPTMKMLRHSLILWLIGTLTASSSAREDLSQVLVGTWVISPNQTRNYFEKTFYPDGSYLQVLDFVWTGGGRRVDEGQWRLEGNRLFLTRDVDPEPAKYPYAELSFQGKDTLLLKDKYDTTTYDRQTAENFVCAEELMAPEPPPVAVAAQRPSRNIDVKPDPVPVTAIIRGSSVERINAASGAYLGGIAVNGTPVDVGCDGETIAVLTSNGSVDRWNAQTGEYRGGVAVQGDIESIQVTGGVLIVRTANSISRFDARSGAYKGGGGL
jgi:hypothetical protein